MEFDLSEIVRTIVLFGALAFLVETMTEYLAAPLRDLIVKYLGFRVPMRYMAAAVGIAPAFVYGLDILPALGFPLKANWAGLIITGLIVGRGSNYTHEFLGLFKALTEGKVIPPGPSAGTRRRG